MCIEQSEEDAVSFIGFIQWFFNNTAMIVKNMALVAYSAYIIIRGVPEKKAKVDRR